MKNKIILAVSSIVLLSALLVLLLAVRADRGQAGRGQVDRDQWGSFTAEKTYSYDGKFYALQTVGESNGTRFITVTVYDSDTDSAAGEFCPARARDFWGICWENDTYNIWTQSADIGIYCYRYDGEGWVRDESAVRPSYIVSKYDEKSDSLSDGED